MAGKPLDDSTLLKFWLGDVVHEAVQKVMSDDPEAGVLGHELAVRDEEHRVSGRLDTLTRTDGIEVEEYKTIDAKAFKYGDLPYDSHLGQLFIYLTFPTEFGMADRGRIAYIGLPGGKVVEFTVEITEEIRQGIKDNLLRLETLLTAYKATGTLPPPLDVPNTDFRIKFCDYLGSGMCCGDHPDDSQGAAAGQADQAQPEAPAVPGVLQLGLLEPEARRPLRRKRKARETEAVGLEEGLANKGTG